jgi:hypothetical protein
MRERERERERERVRERENTSGGIRFNPTCAGFQTDCRKCGICTVLQATTEPTTDRTIREYLTRAVPLVKTMPAELIVCMSFHRNRDCNGYLHSGNVATTIASCL